MRTTVLTKYPLEIDRNSALRTILTHFTILYYQIICNLYLRVIYDQTF